MVTKQRGGEIFSLESDNDLWLHKMRAESWLKECHGKNHEGVLVPPMDPHFFPSSFLLFFSSLLFFVDGLEKIFWKKDPVRIKISGTFKCYFKGLQYSWSSPVNAFHLIAQASLYTVWQHSSYQWKLFSKILETIKETPQTADLNFCSALYFVVHRD